MTQTAGKMITTLRDDFVQQLKQAEARLSEAKEMPEVKQVFNNAYVSPYQDELASIAQSEEPSNLERRAELAAILESKVSGSIYGVAGHLFDLAFFTSGIDVVSEEMRNPKLDYAQFTWLKGRLKALQQDIVRFTQQLAVKYLISRGVQIEGLSENASAEEIGRRYFDIVKSSKLDLRYKGALDALEQLCKSMCEKVQAKVAICDAHTQSQPQTTVAIDKPAALTAAKQPLLASGGATVDYKTSGSSGGTSFTFTSSNFDPFAWQLGWQHAHRPNFFFYCASGDYRNAVIARDITDCCVSICRTEQTHHYIFGCGSCNRITCCCHETAQVAREAGGAVVRAANATANAASHAVTASASDAKSAGHAVANVASHAARRLAVDAKVVGTALSHVAADAGKALTSAAHGVSNFAANIGSAIGHVGHAAGHAFSGGGGGGFNGDCIKGCGGLCACCGGGGVVAVGAATNQGANTANNTAHLSANLVHTTHTVYLTSTWAKVAAVGAYGVAVGPRIVHTVAKPAVAFGKGLLSNCFEVNTYKVARAGVRLLTQAVVATAIGVPLYYQPWAGLHTATAAFGTGVIMGDTAGKKIVQTYATSKYSGISNPEKWILDSKTLQHLNENGIPPQRAHEIIMDIKHAMFDAKNKRSGYKKALEFWWGFLPNCLKGEIENALGETLKLIRKGKWDEAVAKVADKPDLQPIYSALTLARTFFAPPPPTNPAATAAPIAQEDEIYKNTFSRV